jgi:dipeptidyl aminopeptidase/acylaminoacyl peptidase
MNRKHLSHSLPASRTPRIAAMIALTTLAACGGSVVVGTDPASTGAAGAAGGMNAGGAGSTDTTQGVGGSPTSTTQGAGGSPGSTTVGTGGATGSGGSASGCDALPAAIRARRLAFDSDREDLRRQIYAMNGDGSGVVRLLTDSHLDKEPSYSPDGQRISFTSDRDGATQIYLLDLGTNNVTKLTSRAEGADQSTFSHDGSLIAFHSGSAVYVIHPDGSGEQRVGAGLDNFNAYFWPHFSANDAELIVDRNNEIDALTVQGSSIRMIVQNTTTTIKSPAVSPDGSVVAYHAHCFSGGGLSVWTTPFATNTQVCQGRRVSQVEGDSTDSQRAAWATSEMLAYERVQKATNLATIAVISRQAGSLACDVTSPGSDNRNPSWSP